MTVVFSFSRLPCRSSVPFSFSPAPSSEAEEEEVGESEPLLPLAALDGVPSSAAAAAAMEMGVGVGLRLPLRLPLPLAAAAWLLLLSLSLREGVRRMPGSRRRSLRVCLIV